MDTPAQATQPATARSLLLPYALTLIGAMIVIQFVIALAGGEVTILAGVLTAIVAIGIAAWAVISRRKLLHVRFGLGSVREPAGRSPNAVSIATSRDSRTQASSPTLTSAPHAGAKRKELSLTKLGEEFLAGITDNFIELPDN